MRAFWLESDELSRGVMTDPAMTLSVWRALGEDDRPVATDGGPRISERLAAQLGLAYLGFGMPEVVVTRKPHSPVVRLMRRSEFQAMQGSSSALDSDPLVWVVEAQGSWRDAGIVPEEKRQDLSVGLVAFDADTGRRYGASHVNTSLLGAPGGSQPSTPPPPKTYAISPAEHTRASFIPGHCDQRRAGGGQNTACTTTMGTAYCGVRDPNRGPSTAAAIRRLRRGDSLGNTVHCR